MSVITVVAIVCHLVTVPAPQGDEATVDKEKCDEVVLTDSDRHPDLTMLSCIMAQPAIANWRMTSELYKGDDYWLKGWRCIATNSPYIPERDA